ncbi:MAG: DUF4157 domain-containing protein [Candidatus Pristimantibacillus sp.]
MRQSSSKTTNQSDSTKRSEPLNSTQHSSANPINSITPANISMLQQTMGNHAIVQMMQNSNQNAGIGLATAVEQLPRPAVQRKSTSNGDSGLPDHLKTGIEALSGYSMDHVKVHYNSSKPAQLQALAYAQGSEIHLAPGQEQHLPHEAWHIVQQQQGRVQPTMELGGTAINDSPALEREADRRGSEAMQFKQDTNRTSPPFKELAYTQDSSRNPLQMRIQPFATNFADALVKASYQDRITKIVNMVHQRVIQARTDAIQWHAFNGHGSKHLTQWFTAASSYVREPETSPKLIHAKFGYAIETLACHNLGGHGGLQAVLQFSQGHTRPDIVIMDNQFQVAWIDITSGHSEGHIKGKDGAGWKSRPFVYEVLYEPLKLSEILAATGDPFYDDYGAFMSAEHQIEIDEKELKKTEIRNKFIGLQERKAWETGTDNATTKRTETKDFFFGESHENEESEDYRNKMQYTKGALSYLEINDGPYGFNRGKISSDSFAIKKLIDVETDETIKRKKSQLAGRKNMELVMHITKYPKFPITETFVSEAHIDPGSREVAKIGMMLKQALVEYPELDVLMTQVTSSTHLNLKDGRIVQIIQRITELKKQFETMNKLDFVEVWRREHKQLREYTQRLLQVMQAQLAFITYTSQKYTFFGRPTMVNHILNEFNQMPQHIGIIGISQQWMSDNPITKNTTTVGDTDSSTQMDVRQDGM